MLKLPKGLKKKKKGKKSKKDKELFTEEELEQYRREHQKQQQQGQEVDDEGASYNTEATVAVAETVEPSTSKTEDDDEWKRFNALATGVDSILKKTQGDLDRIKSTSFFKRVPPPSEQKKKAEEEAKAAEEVEKAEQEPEEQAEEEKDNLASAVIELSESESESEEADDIFDTTYIDVITTDELPLAYIPDSPEKEEEEGPDPFDTTYAERVIKGPEVSKKGKKIVSIGSAVEVLTGRVDTVSTTTATRRPRRGVQNLLLDNEEASELASEESKPEPPAPAVVVKTLLDDPDDILPDIPIDLSVSLHLTLQKEKEEQKKDSSGDNDIVAEFDELKPSEPEDDEFAQLASESLTKTDEVIKLDPSTVIPDNVEVSTDWAAFEEQRSAENKGKPSRPPPPRPAAPQQVPNLVNEEDLELPEDDVDPFDTAFVDQVVLPDDDDFDPRAEAHQVVPSTEDDELFSPDFPKEENLFPPRDLLGGSVGDLSTLPEVAIAPRAKTPAVEFDPFDTSAVSAVVVPKEVELKFLEKELLADNTPAPAVVPVAATLKQSLSDPDFDPRGLEEADENPTSETTTRQSFESRTSLDIQSRKSSLCLNIQPVTPKAVSFAVPSPDLLAVGENGGKIQKPLTPYYSKEVSIPPPEDVDPFDTSFVADSKPTEVELKVLESDLLEEDDDFDPRAESPVRPVKTPDLLAVGEELNIKVLTPAIEIVNAAIDVVPTFDDPFDTSTVDSNILPGRAELKLLEKELLPNLAKTPEPVLDILSYSQDDSLPVKALTPLGAGTSNSVEEVDIDPFDTSIADNLGPGKTEIKLIESELIGQEQ